MSESNQIAEPITVQAQIAPPAPKRHKDGVLSSVQWLAGTVVIAIFAITFGVQAFQIPSPSMENTLMVGDYLLVDKVHFGPQGPWGKIEPYSPIRRGDIVVFRYPVNPSQHFVKRVIGLPGDRVRLIDKQVYINGKPIREDYVIHRSPARDDYRDQFPDSRSITPDVDLHWLSESRRYISNGQLVVPPDRYFVMGDNRDDSDDSRYWGFVPRGNIIGRPLLIYWSVRDPDHLDGLPPASERVSDKLVHFAFTISHLTQMTRWDRTLRIVR
jgi:signal peptidase I